MNILLEEIGAALARGEKVVIPGFGTFARTSRAARVGRHPRTREAIEIPASNSVSFKASKALKDAVGQSPVSSVFPSGIGVRKSGLGVLESCAAGSVA